MKVFREYLNYLHQTLIAQCQKFKSHNKSPLKVTINAHQKCEITFPTINEDSNKTNDLQEQELMDVKEKCREMCETYETISKILSKIKKF